MNLVIKLLLLPSRVRQGPFWNRANFFAACCSGFSRSTAGHPLHKRARLVSQTARLSSLLCS